MIFKFIKFINFIITVFLLSIYGPLRGLFKLSNYTKKDIIFSYANTVKKFLKFNLYQISNQNIEHNPKIIYLSNHISWSDFFIDHITTNFSSKYLARMIVSVVFPLFYILGNITQTILFFKRGSALDFDKFYKWLDKQLKEDKFNNLLVYPEGTRRAHAIAPCPLKKGIIFYSYERARPVQIIYTLNKELLIDEKHLSANRNINLFVYYSEVIDPIDFINTGRTRDDYFNYIQHIWNRIWIQVNANRELKKITENPKKYKYLLKDYKKLNMTIHDNNNNLSYFYKSL
jgi:hypothetical protein